MRKWRSLGWFLVCSMGAMGCDERREVTPRDAAMGVEDAGGGPADASAMDASPGPADAGLSDASLLDGGPSGDGSLCARCVAQLCEADEAACVSDPACRAAIACRTGCGGDEACRDLCVPASLGFSQEVVVRTGSACLGRADRCRLPCGPSFTDTGEMCRPVRHECVPGGPAELGCCGDYTCQTTFSAGITTESSTHTCTHPLGGTCNVDSAYPDQECRSPSRCDPETGRCALLCWGMTDICRAEGSCCTPGAVCEAPGFGACCIPNGSPAAVDGTPCCSSYQEDSGDGPFCRAPGG